MKKLPPPNWQEARDFLELVTGERDPVACFQAFDDKGEDKSLAATRHGRLTDPKIRAWLTSSAARGCGVFFAVNRMTPGRKRRNEFAKVFQCVAVDFDKTALPAAWGLEPTVINQTSPGRHHVFWKVQPGVDMALWKDTQSRLATYYAGDPSVNKLAGVLRLPGFFHQKAEPFRVRTIKTNAPSPFDLPTLDDIRAGHECEYDPPKSAVTKDNFEGPDEWDRPADVEAARAKLATAKKPKTGDRNNAAYRMAAICNDHALSPEKTLDVLREWNDAQDDPLPDHELQHVTRSAPEYKQSAPGVAAVISAEEEFDGVPIDPKWLPSKAEVEKTKKRRNRFKAQRMSELDKLPPLQWLIDSIVPVGQLVELYGPPKAGKTFAGIDMGLCIATGKDFHGKATRKGRVLHIVAEGNKAAIRDRVKAWTKTYGKEYAADIESNWALIGLPVTIDVDAVLKEFLRANPGKWDFIIVDTMLRNMAGHISDPKDMAAFVRACDDIRELTGAAVMVIHHEGKDKSKGGMGSVAFDAAVDAILKFHREGSNRILRVGIVRDADDNQPDMIFELVSVVLAVNDDLSDVRSAVLQFKGTKAKGTELSAAEKLLKAIYEAEEPNRKDLAAVLEVVESAVSNTAKGLRQLGYLPEKGWTLTPHGKDRAATLAGDDDDFE